MRGRRLRASGELCMSTPESTFLHTFVFFNCFNLCHYFPCIHFLSSHFPPCLFSVSLSFVLTSWHFSVLSADIFRFTHQDLLFFSLFDLFNYFYVLISRQKQNKPKLKQNLSWDAPPLCRLLNAGPGASWWTFGPSSAYWCCPATPPT